MCWCAFLEAAWCPAWDPPGGGRPGARKGGRAAGPDSDRGGRPVKPGLERTHVNPESGKGPVNSGSGTWAGKIRNEKRTTTQKEKINGDAGFYQRLFTGLLTKVFTAPSKNLGFYLGLAASGFYLGKNLGRSPGASVDAPWLLI